MFLKHYCDELVGHDGACDKLRLCHYCIASLSKR